MPNILAIFVVAKCVQGAAEGLLSRLNRLFYLDRDRQQSTCDKLGIDGTDFAKTLAYTSDKYVFGQISNLLNLVALIAFIVAGGFGLLEGNAKAIAAGFGGGNIAIGLIFFVQFGAVNLIFGLPFEAYQTFVVEQNHGFNRQTAKGFFLDRVKGITIGVILGGPVLAGLLYVMEALGEKWWIAAWILVSGFSLFAAWIYPTFLAPLFNKFVVLEDGDLKRQINALADRVGFRTGGIFVMDASTRSSHGNAYFTGLFGEKRIVLFDTLLKSLNPEELVAVLAHELGHFKLHHVRWGVIRGLIMTGMMFFGLSICLPLEDFYLAFGFGGISNYGALVVFTLWFSLADFVLQPMSSFLSRRNEFAADRFAKANLSSGHDLVSALVKLSETNHSMPLTHPVYSKIYYSHPPLLERMAALES